MSLASGPAVVQDGMIQFVSVIFQLIVLHLEEEEVLVLPLSILVILTVIVFIIKTILLKHYVGLIESI